MSFSGFAIVFLCQFCGQPLSVSSAERTDEHVVVTGQCASCGRTINIHTTIQAMLDDIFAKLVPPRDVM